MTKLTDEQHDQLAIIGNLYNKRRSVRSDVMKEIDVMIASRIERINVDLHEAVRKAVASGTPARRIGMAIGTSANRTWTELINESLAVAEVEEEEVEGGSVGGSTPEVNATFLKTNDVVTVILSNYSIDGETVSGEVVFAWNDNAEEWFVQGDTAVDFAVERAIFGADPDSALRAEFDKVVA